MQSEHPSLAASATPDGIAFIAPEFLRSFYIDDDRLDDIEPYSDYDSDEDLRWKRFQASPGDPLPMEHELNFVPFSRTARESYSACGYPRCTCKTRESRSHELKKSKLRLERRGR